MTYSYKHLLIIIIAGIIIFILGLLFAAVTRRILNARKYAALDRYRESYRQKLSHALRSNRVAVIIDDLRERTLSLQWRAVEEVLLGQIANSAYERDISRLFHQLGYRDYYEGKLKSKRAITKAAAIDKLGKMLSESSTTSLVRILNTDEDPEVLTVTVRALCRIRGQEGLKGILERLPELYAKSLVSQKTIEASLINFKADAVPLLVTYGQKFDEPKIKASLLKVLSHLPATPLSFSFAAANLSAYDAEVRARAIRVFGMHHSSTDVSHRELLLPLLEDAVWFVRLQAARALEQLRYVRAVEHLGALLFDQNWQVRNAAARALANIGDASLEVFLNILKDRDRYAKESICDEAQRTNLTQRLIANLTGRNGEVYEKSREILKIMHSLNFSTRLYDYLDKGKKDEIKQEIALLLKETAGLRESIHDARIKPGLPGAHRDREGNKA
ncbi:MAG: HEAT repeat domain-containing protein [Betaproteobacteria bacterium]